MRPNVILRIALFVSVMLLLPAYSAQASSAPVEITCGAVLQRDAYLAADLTCPSGFGVVAAADLSIDLRGHVFTGSAENLGVVVKAERVSLSHGSIVGWSQGIEVGSADTDPPPASQTVRIDRITFVGNSTAVNANGNGVFASPTYMVNRSRFIGNMLGVFGGKVRVAQSSFTKNHTAVSIENSTPGSSLVIESSRLADNDYTVNCSNVDCAVRASTISGSLYGIALGGIVKSSTIENSTFAGNHFAVTSGANGENTRVTGLTVKNNHFLDNLTAVDVSLSAGTVSGNVFTRNRTAVVSDQPSPLGSLSLTSNLAAANGDGFVIRNGRNTSLRKNVALFNSGWGIYAPGADDLGGNRASGNGKTPQCLGVRC